MPTIQRPVPPTQYRRAAVAVAVLTACAALSACQSGGGGGGGGSRSNAPLAATPGGAVTPAAAVQSGAAGKTVVLVGNHAVGWAEITPWLAEASGGQVVEEYALGIALEEECRRRNIEVTDSMVRAERALLASQLTRAANVPASESETLIAGVRRSRGLGDLRFRALLERNAALRALVRSDPTSNFAISADDIETAYQLKHGPRVRTRLILVRSSQTAAAAAQRIAGGQTFAEVAADTSLDPSALRGGMLEPFSLSDSNYPVAVRRALTEMKPGQTSDPIAVSWSGEQGFAILRLEEVVTPPAPAKEAVASELEIEVRTVRERAMMDALARRLLNTAGVSVMDRSLGWSWENRQGQESR